MPKLINQETKKFILFIKQLTKLKDECGENSYEYIKYFNDNFDIILQMSLDQIYFYSRENHLNFTKENIEKLKSRLLEIDPSSHEEIYKLLNFILYVFNVTEKERLEFFLSHGQIPIVELEDKYLFVNHKGYNINSDDMDNLVIKSNNPDICYEYAREIQNRDLPKYDLIPKLEDVVIKSKNQNLNLKFAINIFGADIDAHKSVIQDEHIKKIIDEHTAGIEEFASNNNFND